MACMCEWPDDCGGTGMLQCEGCGGDICVCVCGGEAPCGDCEECQGRDEFYDDEFYDYDTEEDDE